MFRFYILFLLGFMSGIAAGTGSRFMNGKTLAIELSVLRLPTLHGEHVCRN